MGHTVYIRNKKTAPSPTGLSDGWWDEKTKMQVLTAYLATGNLRIASSMYNVPYKTCEGWKTTPWWKERVAEIHEEDNIKLDAKLTKVMEKTLAQLEDRVENGDYYIDRRTGKQKRLPANLRDIHRVASDLIDKQKMIRHEKTNQVEELETTNARMAKLAEYFAEIALGKVKQEKPVFYEGDFKEITDVVEESNSLPAEEMPNTEGE